MKKFLLAITMMVGVILLSACGQQTEFELGETFEFDGLEITIEDNIHFGRINDNWSDNHGDYYFSLPVTITNISDNTRGLNMFSYGFFAPDGTTISDISILFMDDNDVAWAGDIQPGATLNSYMHILHVEDGEHIIEFEYFNSDNLQVIFDVEFDFDTVPEIQTQFSLGETFEFDGLAITIEDNFSWGEIDDSWSDLDGETYFYLPVTFTNIGEESNSLNLWDFTVFGSNEAALESIDWEVEGDDITNEPDVRPGVTVEGYLHILFDGDGEYLIEFDTWDEDDVHVIFNVSR